MSSQTMLLVVKGIISDLAPEDQAKVTQCADQIRSSIAAFGDYGTFAMALVGAEAAVEADKS